MGTQHFLNKFLYNILKYLFLELLDDFPRDSEMSSNQSL